MTHATKFVDLETTSQGQMLSAATEMKGSAGYVAMDRGVQSLSVTVVPDSGTGQLAGLKGKMAIQIDAGKHSYEFEYTLPER
jgi:hypothetical protein